MSEQEEFDQRINTACHLIGRAIMVTFNLSPEATEKLADVLNQIESEVLDRNAEEQRLHDKVHELVDFNPVIPVS